MIPLLFLGSFAGYLTYYLYCDCLGGGGWWLVRALIGKFYSWKITLGIFIHLRTNVNLPVTLKSSSIISRQSLSLKIVTWPIFTKVNKSSSLPNSFLFLHKIKLDLYSIQALLWRHTDVRNRIRAPTHIFTIDGFFLTLVSIGFID